MPVVGRADGGEVSRPIPTDASPPSIVPERFKSARPIGPSCQLAADVFRSGAFVSAGSSVYNTAQTTA
jgi:hypothetical protein